MATPAAVALTWQFMVLGAWALAVCETQSCRASGPCQGKGAPSCPSLGMACEGLPPQTQGMRCGSSAGSHGPVLCQGMRYFPSDLCCQGSETPLFYYSEQMSSVGVLGRRFCCLFPRDGISSPLYHTRTCMPYTEPPKPGQLHPATGPICKPGLVPRPRQLTPELEPWVQLLPLSCQLWVWAPFSGAV